MSTGAVPRGNPPPLVCLITPGHVASTPRLVKNADALAAAGWRVHVIAGRHFTPVDAGDATIFAAASWTHTLVDYRGGLGVFGRKLLRHAARRRLQRPATSSLSVRLAARAHHAETFRLAQAAARTPARLFFGHCLAGLPAAAFAAKSRQVPYGFDAEDFHDGEDRIGEEESIARRILQSSLLPGCAVLTSAAPLISQRYHATYGVEPKTLLNTFPLSEAPTAPIEPGPVTAARPARFYWFSQTIGSGRGLEAVIQIAARMKTPVELDLRGFVSAAYAESLRQLAQASGFTGVLRFLPPAPPAEMARLAATADLGLSTEESHPLNRDLCLTNKIFVYLLAGIPQLLSRTSAQTALAPDLGAAALSCDLAATEETARTLDEFFAQPARASAARATARRLARERYCWDIEKKVLLEQVQRCLARPV